MLIVPLVPINILFCLSSVPTQIISVSSPGPKAQVSYSDHNLSIICRRCHKLFTVSSSPPELLGKFQPIFVQSIIG